VVAVEDGREPEALALAAEGLSNRAIAARLFVTERAVEAHVTQIFQKLGLTTDPRSHRRVLAVLAYLRRPGRALATHSLRWPDKAQAGTSAPALSHAGHG
jgi:DNA-binding CsgD family transcriptional regulator